MENKIDELFNKYGIKKIYETIDENLIKPGALPPSEELGALPHSEKPDTYIPHSEKPDAYIPPSKRNMADPVGDFKSKIKSDIEESFKNISQEEFIDIYSDFYKIFTYNLELETEKTLFFIDIIKDVLNDKIFKFSIMPEIKNLENNLKEQYSLSVIQKLLVAYNKETVT